MPRITAVDPATGRSVNWTDRDGGRFDGDPGLVAAALAVCGSPDPVALSPTGPWVEADRSDPVAVMAILDRVLTGRGVLSGDIPDDALHELAGLEQGEIG